MSVSGWILFIVLFATAILSGLFVSVWISFAILSFVGFLLACLTLDLWFDLSD
jgi:hypothetical protein